MLLELKAGGGVPTRCLACLASRDARVRLRAARGLDTFRDPALFLQFVTRLFTDRGDEKPWTIKPETVDAVADLVAFGPPAVRARTARLLSKLFKGEQAAWDRAWAVHAERFAAESAAVRKDNTKRAADAGAAGPRYTPEQLEELAFGAYVGLVREQGASAGKGGSGIDSQAVGRVRQTALTWLQELAKRNARYVQPARAVFVQALGDPHQGVRTQAFDQLRELKTDPDALGAEALAAGHTDLGVRGLELLSGADSAVPPAAAARRPPPGRRCSNR
jgi:ParB family chromosome partitioning protein